MKTHKHLSQLIASAIDHDLPLPSVIHPCLCPPLSHPSDLVLGVAMNTSAVMPFRASSHHPHYRGHIIPFSSFFLCVFVQCCRRRTLKSTFHPAIFWEMVKFVDLGVLYFSLVLPRQPLWVATGPEWILRSLGGLYAFIKRQKFLASTCPVHLPSHYGQVSALRHSDSRSAILVCG